MEAAPAPLGTSADPGFLGCSRAAFPAGAPFLASVGKGRACALWLLLLWGAPSTEATGPVRVWAGEAVNLWGTPSPDGRWLSFVDSGTGRLALRSVREGSVRPIPDETSAAAGEFAYFSVFDRTGDRIAYAWFNASGHYELRLAVLNAKVSAEPLVLFSNPEIRFVQPCAWSQDGKQLLTLFFREDNTSQIALIEVDSGKMQVLRSLHWIYPKRMDLSPDGRFIVYDNLAEADVQQRDLYILRTDGASERRLLPGPADDQSPVWSHDGGTIWFVSDRSGTQAIWSVAVEEGRAAGSPRRLTQPVPRALLMGATRQGEVFYGQRQGVARLYLQAWEPEAQTPLPAPVPMTAKAPESDRLLPVFAPDGERLAYLAQIGTENQGRGQRTVALHSLRTGGSVALPTRLAFVRGMEFSPHGQSLLLAGSDRRGRSGLFVFDLETQRASPLELAAERLIHGIPGAFDRRGESVFLPVRDPATGKWLLMQRPLAEAGANRVVAPLPTAKRVTAVAVSPLDGRVALAWVDRASGSKAVLALADPAGGPAPEPILELPGGQLTDLAWDPLGRHLLVGTQGNAGARLWLVRASGDSMVEIPSPKDRRPGLSFSPDGKRLAYAAGRTRQEVWVLSHEAAREP